MKDIRPLGELGHFLRLRCVSLQGGDRIQLLCKRIIVPHVLNGTEKKDEQLVCSLKLLSSHSTI